MEVLYPRCCGLDVHQKSVTACVLLSPERGSRPRKEVRTFPALTDGLLALGDWLTSQAVTHVAMESTGVYWKPVWNVLEGDFELLLVNAHHVKQVPGRKTDVKDCEWVADLWRHGLLRPSFVPELPQRELRELTRLRTSRVRLRVSEANRLQKTLEAANLKLGAVASDVLGVSARAMLALLVAGEDDPAVLADLAQGKLRTKLPELERALTGRVGAHQRFLIGEHLVTIDELDAGIARLSAEIATRLTPPPAPPDVLPPPEETPPTAAVPVPATLGIAPGDDVVARLDTIPGVGRITAEGLLAELGTDMTRFPSAAHLASWAGLCPGNNESAGKRRSGKTRKGSPWLRALLVEAAHGASRTTNTYLAARYHRIAARRGKKKAVVAVAHTILLIVYHLLRDGTSYHELGGNFYDERDRAAIERRLVRRLERLGNQVTLTPAAA
jgi:transposase